MPGISWLVRLVERLSRTVCMSILRDSWHESVPDVSISPSGNVQFAKSLPEEKTLMVGFQHFCQVSKTFGDE